MKDGSALAAASMCRYRNYCWYCVGLKTLLVSVMDLSLKAASGSLHVSCIFKVQQVSKA
jgi:hypothetical protein